MLRIFHGVGTRGKAGKKSTVKRRPDPSLFVELLESREVPTATLLTDINTQAQPSLPTSQSEAQMGSYLYFVATDVQTGTELYRTDGTAAGTSLVADINPGPNSSTPANLTVVNLTYNNIGNRLFFTATDGQSSGTELWESDGTAAGTVKLGVVSTASTAPFASPVACNGKLYWYDNAGSITNNYQLWSYDGNTISTVATFNNNANAIGAVQTAITVIGNQLYFLAQDPTYHYAQPYMFDSTTNTVVLIAAIDTTSSSGSSAAHFTKLGNGNIIFQATNGTTGSGHGIQLWVTNSSGTAQVTTINGNSPLGGNSSFVVLSNNPNVAYFTASVSLPGGGTGTQIYQTDGTAGNTGEISDSNSLTANFGYTPTNLTAFDNKLYFSANINASGTQLSVYDPNASSPAVTAVATINSSGNSAPGNLTVANSALGGNVAPELYFSANNGTATQLWESDGVPVANGGTTVTLGSSGGTSPTSLFSLSGQLLYSGVQASNASGTAITQLYTTDGVPAHTGVLTIINNGTGSSNPTNFYTNGNLTYFSAQDGTDSSATYNQPFVYNSATGTITKLADILPTTAGGGTIVFLGTLNVNGQAETFFRANVNTTTVGIYETNGTAPGTQLFDGNFTGILTGGLNTTPVGIDAVVANNLLFFQGVTAAGTQLWVTDGLSNSSADTYSVNAAGTSISFGSSAYPVALGNTVYFPASDGTTTGHFGTELYAVNASAAGILAATRVTDINPNSGSSSPTYLARFNNKVYFQATNGTASQLWYYDPSANSGAGGVGSVTVNPSGSAAPTNLYAANGYLYFSATGSAGTGNQLYSYDGNNLVGNALNASASSSPSNFTAATNPLTNVTTTYFAATVSGVKQLFAVTGNAASAALLSPVATTLTLPTTPYLAAYNGLLYFAGTTAANGTELWRTDGTAAGTILDSDVYPGAAGSTPANLTSIAGGVIFSAIGGDTGFEPYSQAANTTSVALSSSANPATAAQNPSVTAMVSSLGNAGPFEGTIAFTDTYNGVTTPLGTVTLTATSNNQAAIGLGTGLPAGSHTITATYSPLGAFTVSTNTLSQSVTLLPTTTTLTDNGPNPSTTSQSIGFTVSVGGGIPDGETVTLEDASNGNAVVPSTGGALAGGSANLTVAPGALGVGSHLLFAVYGGDSSHAASESTQVMQTVTASSTPLAITSININAGTAPIISAAEAGNIVTITTAGPHGFAANDPVVIADVNSSYNGAYTIATVPTANTFTINFGSTTGLPTVTNTGVAVDSHLTGGLLVNGSNSFHSQRSMVDSIVYTFNQAVTLSPNAFVISVVGQGGQSPSISYASPDGGITWVVTFSGTGVTGNSIANGEYQIVLNSSAVTAVSGGGTLASSDTEKFYRLLGDTIGNGHARVNAVDRNTFNGAFGGTSTAVSFLAYLDSNDDGRVNAVDRNAFNGDFGVVYSGFTATI